MLDTQSRETWRNRLTKEEENVETKMIQSLGKAPKVKNL